MSDDILYFPYISLPETLWTYRSLLYYNSLGVIVPNDYIYEPRLYKPKMRELIQSGLVKQVIPNEYTQDVKEFSSGFLNELMNDGTNTIEDKRNNFSKGVISRIHIEKFDKGLMDQLASLGLSKYDNYPWHKVESRTAFMLMAYLAAIIAIQDNRVAITDNLSQSVLNQSDNELNKLIIKNRILEDILLLPTELNIRKLEKFKGRYNSDLIRFRRNIEQLTLNLNQFEGNPNDFELKYKLSIEEINDQKNSILSNMRGLGFGQIVFGTILPLSTTIISMAHTQINAPLFDLVLMLSSLTTAACTAISSVKSIDNSSKDSFRYLALVDKKLA